MNPIDNGLFLYAWYIINDDTKKIVDGPYTIFVARKQLDNIRAMSNCTFNIYQYVETIEGRIWHSTNHQKAYSESFINQHNQ